MHFNFHSAEVSDVRMFYVPTIILFLDFPFLLILIDIPNTLNKAYDNHYRYPKTSSAILQKHVECCQNERLIIWHYITHHQYYLIRNAEVFNCLLPCNTECCK